MPRLDVMEKEERQWGGHLNSIQSWSMVDRGCWSAAKLNEKTSWVASARPAWVPTITGNFRPPLDDPLTVTKGDIFCSFRNPLQAFPDELYCSSVCKHSSSQSSGTHCCQVAGHEVYVHFSCPSARGNGPGLYPDPSPQMSLPHSYSLFVPMQFSLQDVFLVVKLKRALPGFISCDSPFQLVSSLSGIHPMRSVCSTSFPYSSSSGGVAWFRTFF